VEGVELGRIPRKDKKKHQSDAYAASSNNPPNKGASQICKYCALCAANNVMNASFTVIMPKIAASMSTMLLNWPLARMPRRSPKHMDLADLSTCSRKKKEVQEGDARRFSHC